MRGEAGERAPPEFGLGATSSGLSKGKQNFRRCVAGSMGSERYPARTEKRSRFPVHGICPGNLVGCGWLGLAKRKICETRVRSKSAYV